MYSQPQPRDDLKCVSQLQPCELRPMTVILHPASRAGTAHESHTLHPIYHLNYFHFHIPMYFLMSQINLHLRQIACP